MFSPFFSLPSVNFCIWCKGSSFIPLHMEMRFSQYHLLKKLFFPPVNGHDTFVKDHLTISMMVYFWALCSFTLVYMSVFMPVTHYFFFLRIILIWNFVVSFEIRKCDILSLYILFISIISALIFIISFFLALDLVCSPVSGFLAIN